MLGLSLTLPKIDTGPFNFAPRSTASGTRPREWHISRADPAHFIHNHTQIFNATHERWEPFHLWPAQADAARTLLGNRRSATLKARQLGLTWLALALLLHDMVFTIATVGIFSQREEDANDLLYNRLRAMYERLPAWAQVGAPTVANMSHLKLPNGSSARSFPTTGGALLYV